MQSWPMFFALAFLVIVGGAFFAPTRKEAVTAQLFRTANVVGFEQLRLILISNVTARPQHCQVWAEWSTNTVRWNRDVSQSTKNGELISQSFTIPPEGSREVAVPVPGDGTQHRIAVRYLPVGRDDGGFLGWRYYRTQARASLGLQTGPNRIYLLLPQIE